MGMLDNLYFTVQAKAVSFYYWAVSKLNANLSGKEKKAFSKVAKAMCALTVADAMVNPAFAAGSTTTIFDKVEDMMDTIYISIAGISTVAAGLFAAIAFFQMITATDDRKAGQCIERIKTILIAWILIMLMATILRYVAKSLFGSDAKASLQNIG